jgi:hypothetical protein
VDDMKRFGKDIQDRAEDGLRDLGGDDRAEVAEDTGADIRTDVDDLGDELRHDDRQESPDIWRVPR